MNDWLQGIDERLFWVLHPHHTAWLDVSMWYVSKMLFWSPVYLLLLFALYRRLRLTGFVAACIGIALLLFLTDFLAVQLVKETVQRLRPSHQPGIAELVKLVTDEQGNFYRGGKYGFFSNHASNYAGVIVFFILMMRPIRPLHTGLLLFWLLLISYSRIYLGVHYPLDILAGWMYGGCCGWLIYRLARRLVPQNEMR